jgi:hypothetical protein
LQTLYFLCAGQPDKLLAVPTLPGGGGGHVSKLLLLSCLTVLAALAVMVWPTPYRYDHMASTLVRINRLTGRAQALESSRERQKGQGYAFT